MSLLEYNIMKARHGRYADTAENRRLHRVGQEYGHAAKEDPEAAKKTPKGEESGKEKRTYETARKELSTVLSNKEEFIKKYGQDEFDKRVGALVGEARELRDTEHKAEADKDFEAAKQPSKPKDTRSKKEKRTERLAKYKEQLKKIQDKMNQEGESEESRKMGEALEAKWKAKIEKLEAKVNRGKKKEADSPSEKNKKEFEARVEQAYKDGKISKDAYDAYKKDLAENIFKKEAEAVGSGRSDSQEFWDEVNSDLDQEIAKEANKKAEEAKEETKELSPTEKKVLDLLSHSSSKYNDISKVEVYETAAGNWELVYDGKEVSVVGADQLDHDDLMEAGLLNMDGYEEEEETASEGFKGDSKEQIENDITSQEPNALGNTFTLFDSDSNPTVRVTTRNNGETVVLQQPSKTRSGRWEDIEGMDSLEKVSAYLSENGYGMRSEKSMASKQKKNQDLADEIGKKYGVKIELKSLSESEWHDAPEIQERLLKDFEKNQEAINEFNKTVSGSEKVSASDAESYMKGEGLSLKKGDIEIMGQRHYGSHSYSFSIKMGNDDYLKVKTDRMKTDAYGDELWDNNGSGAKPGDAKRFMASVLNGEVKLENPAVPNAWFTIAE